MAAGSRAGWAVAATSARPSMTTRPAAAADVAGGLAEARPPAPGPREPRSGLRVCQRPTGRPQPLLLIVRQPVRTDASAGNGCCQACRRSATHRNVTRAQPALGMHSWVVPPPVLLTLQGERPGRGLKVQGSHPFVRYPLQRCERVAGAAARRWHEVRNCCVSLACLGCRFPSPTTESRMVGPNVCTSGRMGSSSHIVTMCSSPGLGCLSFASSARGWWCSVATSRRAFISGSALRSGYDFRPYHERFLAQVR